jgi:hypothetical protein
VLVRSFTLLTNYADVAAESVPQDFAAVEGKETLYSFVSPDNRSGHANNLVTWDQVK